MSKNIRSKQQLKTNNLSQSVKKTSSTTTSSRPKKLPTAEEQSSASKDEENDKKNSYRKGVQRLNPNQISNTKNPSATKPSVSRSRESNHLTGLKIKPRLITQKQVQPSNVKPAFSRLKQASVIKPASSKQNLVMNTVHNVTVSSPPLKRKEVPVGPIDITKEQRIRSKSRTLSTEEIMILKGSPVNLKKELISYSTETSVKVKEPVAFEIVFDENQKPIPGDETKNSNSSVLTDSSPEYEDDFESYESDFETGSSSELASESSSSLKPRSDLDDRESPPIGCETDTDVKSEGEEDSELTHIPITVIHRDKELERKLDSGNYDLNSRRRRAIESFDSLDTLPNSEQLDSGISYENSTSAIAFEPGSVSCGGYLAFYTRPKTTKRGIEIMSKIQFDRISFTLLDLKPISYDIFMKMYGSSNAMQSGTQTHENLMESECQTDEDELRSVWTQHPPQYDLVSMLGSSGVSYCTGEMFNDISDGENTSQDIFDNTIQALSKLRQDLPLPQSSGQHKPVNFERLNTFLNSTSSIIAQILSTNVLDLRLDITELPQQSRGFITLNTKLLNALKVVRVFSNVKFNLILTVHESIENVYHTDFSNLIMVWNSGDSRKPLRLLSTWSEVSRAEICNDSSEIVVCGLKDGSIAMWDLRETYSFCSKLDGYLTHFSATHTIAPSWGGADLRSFDLGAVVDVRSFRSTAKTITCGETLKTVQFASLNETGLLAIWTLVETSARRYETSQVSDSKFEYSSPWARVKLVQSAICDLREYIEIGVARQDSAFERTKSNFQKDVFSDDILKELAETQSSIRLGIQGLRFINLDCGTELIFVGTNRNFIISCSKTLKRERFRKINIIGSGFLFPTALRLLQNEDYLVVGLSNGSVIILNCNQEKTNKNLEFNKSENLRRPDTTQYKPSEFDYEIGKSCAIQNIIRNERMSQESRFVEDEFRPNTAALISATLEEGKKPYELRVFDEKVLLNGSILRKDLVQNLEISSDGWMLFALSDGNVRVYDFSLENEVPFYVNTSFSGNIMEVVTSRGYGEEKNLILLDDNNNVQIHSLK